MIHCIHCNKPIPKVGGFVSYRDQKSTILRDALVIEIYPNGILTIKVYAGTATPNFIVEKVPYSKEPKNNTWCERECRN